jgi:hypothetical protein
MALGRNEDFSLSGAILQVLDHDEAQRQLAADQLQEKLSKLSLEKKIQLLAMYYPNIDEFTIAYNAFLRSKEAGAKGNKELERVELKTAETNFNMGVQKAGL